MLYTKLIWLINLTLLKETPNILCQASVIVFFLQSSILVSLRLYKINLYCRRGTRHFKLLYCVYTAFFPEGIQGGLFLLFSMFQTMRCWESNSELIWQLYHIPYFVYI